MHGGFLDGVLYGGVSTGPVFHRGALASPNGLAIVCLASRTPAGEPAIRPLLRPEEPVAIPRADVHWVVTEYGTAYLFGRSVAERAVALIEIAHPDDRGDLLGEAAARGPGRHRPEATEQAAYPVGGERDVRLRDGREPWLRPMYDGQRVALQELFFRCARRTCARVSSAG